MDTPSVRAKFGCTAVEAVDDGFRIKLDAVVAGSEENDAFFKLTPSGHIEIAVVNADTAKLFVKGNLYFVDFTPAVVEAEAPAPADEAVGGPAAPAETPEDAAPAPEDVPAQPEGGEDAPEPHQHQTGSIPVHAMKVDI